MPSLPRSTWLSTGGLIAILLAIFVLPAAAPYPSLCEIMAVLGAALIIVFSAEKGIAGWLLSSAPARFLGLISYSAYLWHQPLMAVARIRILDAEGWPMVAMALLSFVMAYFSWRFIEVPFRDGRRVTRRGIVGFSLAGSVLVVVFGGGVWVEQGFPSRHAPAGPRFADLGIDRQLAETAGLDAACDERFTLSPRCRTADNPDIMLWGDSFAMHLAPALQASDPSIRLIQHTKSWCAPILGVAGTNAAHPQHWSGQCLRFNDQVAAWAGHQHGLRYAILSSPFGIVDGVLVRRDGVVIAAGQYPLVLAAIRQTVSALVAAGIRPVIVSPTPRNGTDIGRCLAHGAVFGAPDTFCDFPASAFSAQTRTVLHLMADISRFAPVVMLSDYLCKGGICHTRAGRVFFYRDSGHLSNEGARTIGRGMNLAGLVRARADAFSYTSF